MKRDPIAYWVKRITETWRDSVGGILATAGSLAKAHAGLKDIPKAWAELTGRGKYEQQLPFKWRAAERLKCVGEDERLVSLTTQLPPDWYCIYELTTLKGNDFRRFQKKIHPGMKQTDVRKFKRELRRKREQAEVATVIPDFLIHHCAIQDVGTDILPDASVDAIITDPPYPEKFLETYSMLSDFADRVLKPSGWCIVMTGTIFLPNILNRLAERLIYRWQYVITTPGGANSRISKLRLYQGYKPVLLFQKQPVSKIREAWSDVIVANAAGQDKSLHDWQQNELVFSELINRFSLPNDLVVDPFAGSGTTGRAAVKLGRHFWGCDIDPACATTSLVEAAE